MPSGFKDFTGEVLTSADVDAYLMQGILVFASTSARDVALTSYLEEGRFCYVEDTDSIYYYNGSAWITWTSPWTNYTPSWTNLTVGAATQDADSRYENGDLLMKGLLTFAADTSVTGNISHDIPGSITADATGCSGVGVAAVASGKRYPLVVDVLPASGVIVFYHAEPGVQSGSESETTDANGDVAITFGNAFDSTPVVTATRKGTATTARHVTVTATSTTGFTVRSFDNTGAAEASTGVTFEWVAHSATSGNNGTVNGLNPFTWGTGDLLRWFIRIPPA